MRRWVGILAALATAVPAQAAWVAPGRLAWPAGGPVGYERQPAPAVGELADGTLILSAVDRDHVDVRHLLADGSEDPTFGSAGVARVPLPAGTATATPTPILQPGGRILLALAIQKRFTGSGLVIAFTADGKPDATYGENGRATVPFHPYAIAAGPDGAMVFGGTRRHSAVISRLTPDGAPDTGLGTNGIVRVPGLTGREAAADTVAVLDDGRLVVLGGTGRSTRALVRLRPDGTPDPTFNNGRPLIPHVRYAFALATLPDGTAAIAGVDAIARITPTGALDSTFGHGGRVDTGLADNGEFWHLLASGGTIYAWRPRAYPPLPPTRPNIDLHTLDAEGLSPTHPVRLPFAGGYVFGGPQNSFQTDQLLLRPGGGWLAIGSTKIIEANGHDAGFEETATFQSALVALTPDLALDATFGGTPTPLSCDVNGIALAESARPYHTRLWLTFTSTVPGLANVDIRTRKWPLITQEQLPAYVAGRNTGSPAYTEAAKVARLRHGQRVRVQMDVEDIFGRHATCAAPLTVR